MSSRTVRRRRGTARGPGGDRTGKKTTRPDALTRASGRPASAPKRAETASKPRPEPAPATKAGPEAPLWDRVVDLAAEQTSDTVLVDQLIYVEHREGVVRLRQADGSPPGENWITARRDRIEELVRSVLGEPVGVELLPPSTSGTSTTPREPDPKFRQNPLVLEAMQLFDATIQSVRELPRTTPTKDGDPDDV